MHASAVCRSQEACCRHVTSTPFRHGAHTHRPSLKQVSSHTYAPSDRHDSVSDYRFGWVAHGGDSLHDQAQSTRLAGDVARTTGGIGPDAAGLCDLHPARSSNSQIGVGAVSVGGSGRRGDESGVQMAESSSASLVGGRPCDRRCHRLCVAGGSGIRFALGGAKDAVSEANRINRASPSSRNCPHTRREGCGALAYRTYVAVLAPPFEIIGPRKTWRRVRVTSGLVHIVIRYV